MEARQKKILIIAGIALVVIIIFLFLFKYGMQLFVEDSDYFKVF